MSGTVSAHDNRSDLDLCRTGSDQIVLHIHREEGPKFTDSLEIGTASKGGALKIYFNADNPEAAMKRIQTAFRVRAFAQDCMVHPPEPGARSE